MVERVQTGEGDEAAAAAQAAADAAAVKAAETGVPGGNDPAPKPEGGVDKFYDAAKGTYNWEAHAKDSDFRSAQSASDKAKAADAGADAADGTGDDLTIPKDGGNASEGEIDFQAVANEFVENGKLEDTTYKIFTDRGIPKDVVDAAIAGNIALTEQARQPVFEAAGGEKEYGVLVQWAADNYDANDIAAYDEIMEGRNPAQMKMAVSHLRQRYEDEEGSAPKVHLDGGGGGGAGAGNFTSWAQVQAAMADPRYKTDPAYRDTVTSRMKGDIKQ